MENPKIGEIVYCTNNKVWSNSPMKIICITNDICICLHPRLGEGGFKLENLTRKKPNKRKYKHKK